MTTKYTKIGRPFKYTPQEIEKRLKKYFEEVKREKRPVTVTGIAIALDTNRQTLINYENRAEEYKEELERYEALPEEEREPGKLEELKQRVVDFGLMFDSIMRAKQQAELYAEESLWQPKISNGVAFALKNNFNWVDRKEVNQSGNITVNNATYKADDPK